MKTFKITLLGILAVGLLTAVLPTSNTETVVETSNHDIKEVKVELSSVFNKKDKASVPENG
ncbi:hypothetical protein [Pontimicrobium sp. MEBiC06410]|jgi:hypothetical protein